VSPATAQSRLPVVCKHESRNNLNDYDNDGQGKTCEAFRAGINFKKVLLWYSLVVLVEWF